LAELVHDRKTAPPVFVRLCREELQMELLLARCELLGLGVCALRTCPWNKAQISSSKSNRAEMIVRLEHVLLPVLLGSRLCRQQGLGAARRPIA
jgi:hypothetical protein